MSHRISETQRPEESQSGHSHGYAHGRNHSLGGNPRERYSGDHKDHSEDYSKDYNERQSDNHGESHGENHSENQILGAEPASPPNRHHLGNSQSHAVGSASAPADTLGNTVHAPCRPRAAAVSINDLPVETLVDIFAHLSPAELKDLRLVCRRWNHAASDKAVWTRAFRNRFGTGDSFASVTRSSAWLAEYFGRVARTRQWSKAKAHTHSYSLVNSQYGAVEFVEADFGHDRLMTFSRVSGSLASCALVSGRNQVFIPENLLFTRVSAYDASWTHLAVGTGDGAVYVKNLVTATAAASSRSSVVTLAGGGPPVVQVRVRRAPSSVPGDVAAVDAAGLVRVWPAGGGAARSASIFASGGESEKPLYMATDFSSRVWVVTSSTVRILSYPTLALEHTVVHGADLDESAACHVDVGGGAVAIVHDASVWVVRGEPGDADRSSVVVAQLPAPAVHSALQTSGAGARSAAVAGGDGRLLAVAMADGSVAVYNVRARGALRRQCHILPFSDARAPHGMEAYTKVAVDSSVVAVAVAAGWVHFYDSHSGRYLREGAAVTRRLTRHGTAPVSAIVLGPGASGVVVCGDVVQHFSYGSVAVAKRPSAPQAVDTASRRARQYAIRAQLDEWDLHQHHQHQSEARADKFNGTAFESEQEELRMAMALSASYTHRGGADEDAELALALEMSRQASARETPAGSGTASGSGSRRPDSAELEELAELADLEWALEMSRYTSAPEQWSALAGARDGSAPDASASDRNPPHTSPAPGGISSAPGGISSAPGGISSAPGGISSAPGGISSAPGGISSAPHGFSSAPHGSSPADPLDEDELLRRALELSLIEH